MDILNDLKTRGILNNITSEQKFLSLPKNSGVYIGFDPSAASLHLGNYVQIAILKKFQNYGFKPLAILGGATGMIGDPSGKSKERNLLSDATLAKNKQLITQQLQKYGFKVIDNYSFYQDVNLLTFLRNVGKLLNINYMLNKEIVKSRLDSGISFTEFSYQLIQGWDFKNLYENYNVKIQVGGSDQWGNITSGIEIIRKTVGEKNQAVGITTNLLTTASGVKFGKSVGNAIWLDPKMTSPFNLYQYLFNTADTDIEKLMFWLTDLPVIKIKNIVMSSKKKARSRVAQKVFAHHLVSAIHSPQAADQALKFSEILFGDKSVLNLSTKEALMLEDSIPTTTSQVKEVQDFLVTNHIVKSKREAREFINQGAIEINGLKIQDINYVVNSDHFEQKLSIVKKGKRSFFLVKHF